MIRHSRIARPFVVSLVGAVVGAFVLATDTNLRAVNDTIWVANRLASVSSIREFDAATGDVVRTVAMAPNSQPGDLAYAKGKLYVAEEFGIPPAVAVIDAETGGLITRIPFPNQPPFTAATGWRPHHVHASEGGTLVAVGLSARTWSPSSTRGRHAPRSVGQQPRHNQRPCPCRGLLERRQHAVSGERRRE